VLDRLVVLQDAHEGDCAGDGGVRQRGGYAPSCVSSLWEHGLVDNSTYGRVLGWKALGRRATEVIKKQGRHSKAIAASRYRTSGAVPRRSCGRPVNCGH
jgi:hypothetical protein